MTEIALVACVKSKCDQPKPAGHLYDSTWFRISASFTLERLPSVGSAKRQECVTPNRSQNQPYHSLLGAVYF